MTTTPPTSDPNAALPTAAFPRHVESLPWRVAPRAGVATFARVTAEMAPTAVLPHMTAELGVSEAPRGLLVSGWAAVVVRLASRSSG